MALNKKSGDNQSGEYTSQFDELETATDEATENFIENTEANEICYTAETKADTTTTTENITEDVTPEVSAVSLEKSSDTDTQSENGTYTSQFGELEGYVDDYNSSDFQGEVANCVMPESNKKKINPKKLAVILGITVAVIAALAVGIYFVFFHHSIKGTWAIDNNGTNIYYTFKDDTLEMSVNNGYMQEKLSYNISYGEDNTFSYMTAGQVYQTFTYEITGNLIEGKTLTIALADYLDSKTVFTSVMSPEAVELKGPEFTKNEDIIGYWKSTDGYNTFMEFTDDGSIHNYYVTALYSDDVEWKYNYDGEFIVTLSAGTTDESGNITGEGEETSVAAQIVDDQLTLGNVDDSSSVSQSNIYVRSSKEEYEEYKAQVLAGTYNESDDTVTSATEAVTAEAATEAATETVTQTETTAQ